MIPIPTPLLGPSLAFTGDERSARLAKACACGRTGAWPCPSLADLPAAEAAAAAEGWSYGEHGRVACPDCSAASLRPSGEKVDRAQRETDEGASAVPLPHALAQEGQPLRGPQRRHHHRPEENAGE